MTLVVKLGSSVVANDDGSLREDVLDSVCAQVGALERGGERVVLVTSGAIARGMRLLDLGERPRGMDALQACSAIGQGDLFRAYESRLAEDALPEEQAQLQGRLQQLYQAIGTRPGAYYAILLADGDNMGKVLDHQQTIEHHRQLSLWSIFGTLKPFDAWSLTPA